MKTIDPKTTALLIIDVINDFQFEGSQDLLAWALPAAKCIRRLKQRMRKAGVPVIYVNDNFGHWQSDFRSQVERCRSLDSPGHAVVEMLLPDENDYFVLKPKHSAFYSTALEVLLDYLGTHTLILTGFAGDICVMYSANDAYMREYSLIIAADGVASESAKRNDLALAHMRTLLKARVVKSSTIQ